MKRKQPITILKVILAVIFWGISFVAIKVVVAEVQPFTVIWLRFGMGVLILGGTVLARRQFALPARKDLGMFAILGFLGIPFHQWLQTTGMQTAQASTAAWLVTTSPVFIALLGWILLKERINWLQALGIALALFGVVLIVERGSPAALFSGKFGSIGDLLILISAPNWAFFSVLSRRMMKHHPAARVMFYVMTIGWLLSTVLFIGGLGWQNISQLTERGWLGILFLGVFCSGLAYVFWYDALEALPASTVGAFLYLEPLVTLVASAILIQEIILVSSLVGGGIILLGVWMVGRNTGREINRPQQPDGVEASGESKRPG